MPVTVLALTSLRPGGDSALQTYLDTVGPLMQAAGARLVSRHGITSRIAGESPAEIVSLVEYPSITALRQVFEDPTYLALAPIRQAAFSHYEICVLDSLS